MAAPTAADYILEGLAEHLELERELGVKSVEFDRTLLQQPTGSAAVAPRKEDPRREVVRPDAPEPDAPKPEARKPGVQSYDFVFLHHARLGDNSIALMSKAITAMKKTGDTAPIVFTGERPKARVYVVLGKRALEKWFPGKNVGAGGWFTGDRGEQAILTHSPDEMLRFGTAETPLLQKQKRELWTALKSVMQRVS